MSEETKQGLYLRGEYRGCEKVQYEDDAGKNFTRHIIETVLPNGRPKSWKIVDFEGSFSATKGEIVEMQIVASAGMNNGQPYLSYKIPSGETKKVKSRTTKKELDQEYRDFQEFRRRNQGVDHQYALHR